MGFIRKYSFFLLATLFLFQPGSILTAQEYTLLRNSRIYTMGNKGLLQKGMILIRGKKIEKIGESIDYPSGARIIDLSGKTIIPGIVCASSSLFLERKDRTFSGEEKLDADILEGLNYFDMSIAEMLKHGVTTVYISPVSFQSIGGLGAVLKLKANKEGSLEILKARAGLKLRLERMENKKTSSVLRLTQYNRIRDLFKQAQEYRKEWDEYEKKLKEYEEAQKDKSKERDISVDKKLKEPKKPRKNEPKEILVHAMEKKIPVFFEVHRPDTILNALRLAKEFGLKIILESCEEWNRVLPQLKDASVPILSNPLLNYKKFMLPGGERGYAAGLLDVPKDSFFYSETASSLQNEKAEKNWAKLVSLKIPFALIPPDHFPLSTRYMRLFASLLVSRGISTLEALKAITSMPAGILGVSERIGSLERGKDADLVVLDGEPLSSLSTVKMVFVDGLLAWEGKK
ncbi:MAG: amidohydrolase family protein [Candidatus Aminicenantes bacterium]|nr:MAG: amidohydrolase family protein [Candidatus Aminicenantes bacterium]